jgi:steroid 5-alpha reductase family enzyme
MSLIETLLLTAGLTIVLFYWVWVYSVKIENFGVIDAAWAGCFTIHALVFFNFSGGFLPRKLLFLLLIAVWSLRLAIFLAKRIKSHHPQEDTRYKKLREEYGTNYKNRFLYFFMFQAVSVCILTAPMIFVFNNPNPNIGLVEWIGAVCFFVSLAGESLADNQMSRFKVQANHAGKVCNVGLWRYSRHPNYFFESCIWFSFYIFMLGTPNLWWAVYAPLIILGLLVKVTGVPPSEAQSLATRGDAYREYQKKTSVFVPWFPREK